MPPLSGWLGFVIKVLRENREKQCGTPFWPVRVEMCEHSKWTGRRAFIEFKLILRVFSSLQ
jgi:hypothetical protein